MGSKFLKLFFSLSLFLFLVSPAYAQEQTETIKEEVVNLPVYTKEEVAEHNLPEDCWMSFEGGVYDLSEYIPNHDKFMDIRAWCGSDITADFKDKAGEDRDHRASSYALLEEYRIGNLKGDFDLVDAQVIVDEVTQKTEETTKEVADTSSEYNILIPFIATTILYWGMYILAIKKVLGLTTTKFNGFWNTVLFLTLLISSMGFGVFMIIRTQKPELWDINFDFMYWHVELSLVMGLVAIYHFIQRFDQYILQLKKEKSI